MTCLQAACQTFHGSRPSAAHQSLAAPIPSNTGEDIALLPVAVLGMINLYIIMTSKLEPSRPTLGLREFPEPFNSSGLRPSFTDARFAVAALPPDTSTNDIVAGDRAINSEASSRNINSV